MYAFITVRTASSRLPNKCLLPFGKGTVLQHVINRAKYFGFTPVVCTTTLEEDNVIAELAADCLVFRGSVKDKLSRWLGACDKFGIASFHQFDADDLFLDGNLAKDSMTLLSKVDIVYPSENIFIGGVGFSVTRDLIAKACNTKNTDDTEMMWHFIEKLPNVKATTLGVFGNPNIRLTLDYEEDYLLLRVVLSLLGEYATIDDIERLFLNNPSLKEINWFRNEQWKSAQEARRDRVR
jgi:spore coat polysaccharide biosynthesis protein SpsF (cytidylyltransferase family)